MAAVANLTIEDFEKLPDTLARYRELVDGELVDVSGNVGDHNSLRDLLVVLLRPFVDAHRLGRVIGEQEYDFGGNAHGPDVSFMTPAKAPLYNGKRRVQPFVPDLAIEIVSENDTFTSLMRKAQRYLAFGVQEVYILEIESRRALLLSDRRESILGENDLFAPETIPGFSIRIGELLDSV